MKDFRRIKLVFLVVIMFCLTVGTQVFAATKNSTSKKSISIEKIFYYKDNQNARASLFEHPSAINILAPQAYSIDDAGILYGAIDSTILAFTQKEKIKVMPLVTNKGFSKNAAESILDNPGKQDLAINALIDEAEQKNYWGWQIDFEGIDASYKDKYSTFVKKMGAALKEHNLIFSVAVVAQISSNPSDYKNNLWNRVIGVYDYGPLSGSADFISVMSYDDPDSTGPVAPYPWLEKVINYSLKFIPADKLSLGIPFYYWKWNNTSGKLVSVGGYAGIKNTLKKVHTVLGYSTVNKTSFIEYTVKKNKYEIWYENAKSIAQKIDLIKEYKLQGFSAWMLGLETPNIYSVLK